ncbi:MAG: hypothetical protein ONB13_00955 [candidate division KSB1 bacterium]|nr:hypothetical protein [candidate division KSB1 bacterium]MDZ7335563.1 hypothetical protein [candidate division KSB1 bacterium]MDZ7356435.1 hypothetical protein [candidate division KSB1 bacterium]MDZ7375161.1 hypothetical protein [candidate division KSB1 bacterium]MDZ7401206.1 hypothetical protein [candidate division KSB1 bacterium]
MNDVITILIILAALISFLNKIFGQRKKAGTEQRLPNGESPLPSWFPPWLESDTEEFPKSIPKRKKSEQAPSQQTEKRKAEPLVEPVAPLRQPQPYAEPSPAMEAIRSENPLLRSVKMALESNNELKRAILFAEILGPCRAKRRTHRII